MSDTSEQSVTDATGRKITMRVLDPADMLDLLEAAGDVSSNIGWIRYASVVASVSSIGDIPVPIARSKAQILITARKLGNDGFAAVSTFLFGDGTSNGAANGAANGSGTPSTEDLAKN